MADRSNKSDISVKSVKTDKSTIVTKSVTDSSTSTGKKSRRMGYSLARSKTVSDIPLLARNSGSDSVEITNRLKPPPSSDKGIGGMSPIMNNNNNNKNDSVNGSTANLSSTPLFVKRGSLRSKVVKHSTLLGSASRLYKFRNDVKQRYFKLNLITVEFRN